jgi:hypothetical protein
VSELSAGILKEQPALILIYRKNKNEFWPGQEHVASIVHSLASEIRIFFEKILVRAGESRILLGKVPRKWTLRKVAAAVNY